MTELNERQIKWQARAVFVSCVVPVMNEEAAIVPFVQALSIFLKGFTDVYEIILIDDGSTDRTPDIIKNELLSDKIRWIQFSRNFGKENALTAGLHHAQGDAVLLMDADFQHPFETAKTFFEYWRQGYDMVYGVRENREDEGYLKQKITRLFYHLIGKMSEIDIPADAGDFRLLGRPVVEALNQFGEQARFMKGLYACVGFKSKAVPYAVVKRTLGKSSFHFRKLFSLALTGIISFSDLPLRVWTLVGMLISGISFIYALWIVFDTLYYGVNLPGYATIVVCILFFGGVQLLSIGILGEYIARIFNEVKKRPLYIIKEKT
ncbi:MAG: glycosyltransferase family 2 protein [Gammaproteobacteria bacterium]|nr:glycosyltransferase family 2 protein [Gammaproteobacteria bacterium]